MPHPTQYPLFSLKGDLPVCDTEQNHLNKEGENAEVRTPQHQAIIMDVPCQTGPDQPLFSIGQPLNFIGQTLLPLARHLTFIGRTYHFYQPSQAAPIHILVSPPVVLFH